MNRFGVIEEVIEKAIAELKERYSDMSWQQAVIKDIVDNYEGDFQIQLSGTSSIPAYELKVEGSDSIEVASEIHRLLSLTCKVDGYDKGDGVLKYYLYHTYAKNHPMEVFLMDKEITLKHPNAESDVTRMLKSWKTEMKYMCDMSSRASIACLALWYVIEHSEMIDPPRSDAPLYKEGFYNCLCKQDIEYLEACYRDDLDVSRVYFSVLKELKKVLSRYMDIQTILSTPIAVSSLYYCYLFDEDKHLIKEMYTESQGVRALSTIKKICKNTHGIDMAMVMKVFKTVNSKDLYADNFDINLAHSIRDLLLPCIENQKYDRYRPVIDIVATELNIFRSSGVCDEVLELYDTHQLLVAYCYNVCSKDLVDRCLHDKRVIEEMPKVRRVLPAALSDLSDVAALCMYISNLPKEHYKNYYDKYAIKDVLSDSDIKLIKNFYDDVDLWLTKVGSGLSWFADKYWFPVGVNAPIVILLGRCIATMDWYREHNFKPLLLTADKVVGIREIVEDKYRCVREEDKQLAKFKEVELLTYLVLTSHGTSEQSVTSPIGAIPLSTRFIKFLITENIVGSEEEIVDKVNMKLAELSTNKYGTRFSINCLSALDRMRLFVYEKAVV